MNSQKPEPRAKGDGSTLDFHSMFFTLQGEGPFTGHRSIFVRLAGCNLQCPGCDTEYTEGRKELPIEFAADGVFELAAANEAKGCLVVITGGEPLRQPIGRFVELLLKAGHAVQIESNGVFSPDPVLFFLFDQDDYGVPHTRDGKLTLVVSPKTTRVHPAAAMAATCFKYVLSHDSVNELDGLPIKALEHPASTGVARPPAGKRVYINPYDAKDEALNQLNLKAAAESALKHGYILGVQLHKLVGLE